MALIDAMQQEAFWVGACTMFIFLLGIGMVSIAIACKVDDIKAKAVAEYKCKNGGA